MKSEELFALREKVDYFRKRRDYLVEVKKQLDLKSATPEDDEYKELKNEFEEALNDSNGVYLGSSDNILVSVALREVNITPTENIYVYIGTYKKLNDNYRFQANTNVSLEYVDSNADYVVYYNLDAKYNYAVKVPAYQVAEFESVNKIIIPDTELINENYFYKLQREYFELVVLKSQEEANEMINGLIKKQHQ